MRPSRAFLWLGAALVVASFLLVALTEAAPEAILVLWAALAGMAGLDALLSLPARRVGVVSPPSRELFAGEATALSFLFEGKGGALVQPRARLGLPQGFAAVPETTMDPKTGAAFEVRAERRGVFRPGPLSILSRSRLRLFDLVRDHPVATELKVVPSIRSVTGGEVRMRLSAANFGTEVSALRGEGAEFHQLREFVAGMDARNVDWKRSARHGALLAREMRTEVNCSIVLALDNGHLMRENVEGLPKIDHMISAALALAFACLQSGDMVGLYAFDARPRLYVPPDRGARTFSILRSRAAEIEYRSIESNPTLALSHLQTSLKRRSLVILFSDFVDSTTAELLVENVVVMRRRHVVVFVTLKDPVLDAYGRRPARSLEDVARTVAAADLAAERARVLERLRRLGILVVEALPGRLVAPLLDAYLAVKGRGLL